MEKYLQDYYDNHPKSLEKYESAKEVLPLGVTSNIRANKPFPFFVDRAEGCRVWDIDGNEYIDCQCSFGPTMIGHCHPVLTEAVKAQIDKGVDYAIPYENEQKAARLLLERYPFLDMVRFSCSGTEATMHAMRMARAYTAKEKVIKLEGGFHGAHDEALWSIHPDVAQAGPADEPTTVCMSAGVPQCLKDTVIVVPFNDIDALEKAIAKNRGEIAAFILEPIMANSTVILPKEGYMQKVREITERENIVLIFDEVICGARASWGGGAGAVGVEPDMVTVSKAIGGGYPISAILGKEGIMKHVETDTEHCGTFGGNPLSICACITVLEKILTKEATERLAAKSDETFKAMDKILTDAGIAHTLQHIGPMGSINFGITKCDNYRDMMKADIDMWHKFYVTMLNNGVIMQGGDATETIFFSVQMTDDDFAKILEAFKKTIDSLK